MPRDVEATRSVVDLHNVPLSAMGQHSRELLWALLDTEKVIPSADGHPRDWRGLSALAEIPGQYYSSIHNCDRRTEKVLQLWAQKNDGTATIGRLQECLQSLDRWDIYDDTVDLFEKDAALYEKQQARPVPSAQNAQDDRITFHDVALYPKVQRYHAYVLYAREDAAFAEELIDRLKGQGFMICSEADLLVGFATPVSPISRLFSERCQHIIVIYSPDFLECEANKFYMDYAQALGIETRTRKIVPCMYRACRLPSSYSFYHMLYYTPERNGVHAMYNFWDKLSASISIDNLPRSPVTEVARSMNNALPTSAVPAICAAPTSAPPAPASDHPAAAVAPATPCVSLPESQDTNNQDTITFPDTPAISELSITSEKPNAFKKMFSSKKPNIFKKMFKLKKNKSKIDKTKPLLKAVAV